MKETRIKDFVMGDGYRFIPHSDKVAFVLVNSDSSAYLVQNIDESKMFLREHLYGIGNEQHRYAIWQALEFSKIDPLEKYEIIEKQMPRETSHHVMKLIIQQLKDLSKQDVYKDVKEKHKGTINGFFVNTDFIKNNNELFFKTL